MSTERRFGDLSWRSGLLPSWRRRLAPAASLVSQLAPAFAVWLGLVTSTWPRAHPVLYLRGRISDTAVPPYISGRTSYLQVRLEFLRYPHVIPQICNSGGFGPRRGVTPASPCPWVDHLVSGRIPATEKRPIQTRFRYGCATLASLHLATEMHSPDHSTKGTPSGGGQVPIAL